MGLAKIDPETWASLPDVTEFLEPVPPGEPVDPREAVVVAEVYEEVALA